jgi:hypothetical protein
MTGREITDLMVREIRQRSLIALPNIFYYYEESDVLAITKSDYFHEYEVKVSKSDYLADFKKKKHKRMADNKAGKQGQIPNRFSFVVPQGMVEAKDVPKYAGLIHVTPTGALVEVKKAPMIHTVKPSQTSYFKKCYYKLLDCQLVAKQR